jgi:hypothetical protein
VEKGGFIMKKNFLVVLVVGLTLSLGFVVIASANNGALADFNAQYPGNSFGSSCNICHTSPPTTNPYGTDLVNAGATSSNIPAATFVAVEALDSDGDGFTNIVEINAGTFPGNPASHPAAALVTVTAPIAAEVIPSGSPYTILYDAPAEVTSVKVKYSLNGGVTWLTAVDAGGSVLGSFNWNVPTPVKNTTKALVKVIGFNVSNVRVGVGRSAKFTIEVVTITAPVAQEIVPGGTLGYAVTWTTNGTKSPPSSAKVFYTYGSSGIWKLAKGVVDPLLASFSWNVPSPKKPKIVKLKVVLRDDVLGVNVGVGVSKAFIVQ